MKTSTIGYPTFNKESRYFLQKSRFLERSFSRYSLFYFGQLFLKSRSLVSEPFPAESDAPWNTPYSLTISLHTIFLTLFSS